MFEKAVGKVEAPEVAEKAKQLELMETNKQTNTYVCVYIYIYTHTYTYIHIHTYTEAGAHEVLPSPPNSASQSSQPLFSACRSRRLSESQNCAWSLHSSLRPLVTRRNLDSSHGLRSALPPWDLVIPNRRNSFHNSTETSQRRRAVDRELATPVR